MAKFAQVILPLPLYSSFTYSVPEEFEEDIDIGSRVLVQFGRKNYYTGIVELFQSEPPAGIEVKPIVMVLDSHPILRFPQLKFWNWIADYYLCSVGEVYKAALPSGLKVESETYVTLNSEYEFDESTHITDRMALIIQVLDHEKRLNISDIEKHTGLKNVSVTINEMLDKGMVLVDERIVDKYRARVETLVRLNCDRNDSDTLHHYFELVKRAKQQERMLIAYLDISKWMQTNTDVKDVFKKDLIDKAYSSPAVLKGLVDKGIFEIYKKEVNRFKIDVSAHSELPLLSDCQSAALSEIDRQWNEKNVVLLRGVTGSGKTEIYTHLIQQALDNGNQILYLVPEISLTTQLTTRLRRVFGDKLLIYHSKFTDNERVDVWKKLLSTREPLIVLGVRSSVFLPFARLGLVIVDEEHEASYKQYEPAPRYNARDAAIILASMHGAKVLLGSATPSIETYYKSQTGKYGLVELLQRYAGVSMPNVEIVNMRDQRKRKLNTGIYSDHLLKESLQALGQGRQVIMFQNRRGYSPVVECNSCAWVPKCVNCDVSLVYHKNIAELRCHYCGYMIKLPNLCPACGMNTIDKYGYGTERIADELNDIFKDYKVVRMDLDTTRNKDACEDIIEEFSNHKTDVLVGTQMVTKGLDFEKVKVVGILNADTMLNYPDFRSHERAYNMMEQVAGRAGRRNDVGNVIIQTNDPSNRIVGFVKEHDYMGYYDSELSERMQFNYPPFTKIINIYLKHRDRSVVDEMAVAYTMALKQVFGNRVFGPERPIVSRISTYYIQTIMLKIESAASMKKVKRLLRQIYEQMSSDSRMRAMVLYYDVDPV